MPTPEELMADISATTKEFKDTLPAIKEIIAGVQPAEIKQLGVTTKDTAEKLTRLESRYDAAAKEFEAKSKELAERLGLVAALEKQAKDLQERLDTMEAKAKQSGGGFDPSGGIGFKTIGEQFADLLSKEDWKAWRDRVVHSGTPISQMGPAPAWEGKTFEGQPGFMKSSVAARIAAGEHKTDAAGLGTTTSTISILPYRIPGYVPLPQRTLRIRDLMPVVPAVSPTISFLTQIGWFATATSAVSSAVVGANDSGGAGFQLVTVTTATANGWRTFDYIQIAGATPAAVNGNFRITVAVTAGVLDATHFTYTIPNGTTPGAASGTVTALRLNNYGAAGFTAEGMQKPSAAMKFIETLTSVQVIAHFIAATRQILDDFPGLRNDVDNDLIYGLMRTEEYQLLYGNGSSPKIQGVMALPNIQQYLWSAGKSLDTKMDAIRRAMTRIQIAELEADGVIVHPIDFEDIETVKNSIGAYMWQWAQAADGQITRIWRLPLVVTPAIQPGDFLVGAWQTASALYEKEQVNVRFTDSHADYFTANMLAILAEERIAPVWKRPEAFLHGVFDSAPA